MLGLELSHVSKRVHWSDEVGCLCAGQRQRGDMVLSGLTGSGHVGVMLGRDTKVSKQQCHLTNVFSYTVILISKSNAVLLWLQLQIAKSDLCLIWEKRPFISFASNTMTAMQWHMSMVVVAANAITFRGGESMGHCHTSIAFIVFLYKHHFGATCGHVTITCCRGAPEAY